MADGALDVALALWRQPSLRPALRAQPLPDDVGTLIALAAGAPGRIARAAAEAGEAADDVLDAVRFYLREVVLHADSDAYRVLGVAADAPAARLKAHHRTLQHWLHPDRRGRDDDAVYAARINTAWSLLRTPERRAAYDALHAGDDAGAAAGAHKVLVSGWRADAPPPRRRRDIALLALAAALVAWLLVLAARQALAPPPEWEPVRVQGDASAEDASRRATARGRDAAGDDVPFEGRDADALSPLATAAALRARRMASEGAVPVQPSTSPGTLPDAAEAATAVDSARAIAVADAAQAPDTTGAGIQWSDGTSAVATSTLSRLQERVRDARDARNGESAAPMLPATASAADDRIRTARDVDDARVAAYRPLPPPRREPAMADAQPERPVPEPRLMSDVPPPAVDAARALAAQRRGQQLAAYLRGSGERAPPIWASATALDSAEAARQRFVAARAGGLQLGDAAWRIGSTRASMTAPVHGDGDPAGRLHVELAWRDGTWLVDRLQLDAPPALAP